jgi:integrase
MATRRNLTDRGLRALAKKPAKPGTTYDVADSVVGGLRVRVSETGRLTFVLLGRFGGSSNPTRRALGTYGELTLEQARTKAREWLGMIGCGIDPAVAAERERQAALRTQANTFGSVAEEYIARKIAKTAKARASELEIRNELIARWEERPIADITRHDVIRMAEEIGERAPYQAHNVFGHCRALFNWAIARGVYGLETSPCDRLKPADMIGRKEARSRVLSDDELRALWKATGALDYPYGPLFRLLALTGQRKSEVAEARWSEIDLQAKRWVIPAERMKADAPHVVPLSDAAMEVLRGLPRFARGDCLFSTTFGARPVNGFSKAKDRLDAAIAAELGAAPPPFVLHDIRRTVRTRMSAFTSSDVAELVIAHTRPGLRKVYDLHAFEDEKREALDKWAARLRSIVEPAPPNVIIFENPDRKVTDLAGGKAAQHR